MDTTTAPQGRRQVKGRLAGVGFSVAAHLLAALGILLWRPEAGQPMDAAPDVLPVVLTRAPEPKPPAKVPAPTEAAAEPAPASPSPPAVVRPTLLPPPPNVTPLVAVTAPKPVEEPLATLGDGELVGARTAGAGGGGNGSGVGGGQPCDMVQRVQDALRNDPDVQAAARAANPGGRAILVWNGDWLKAPGQAGKGLAGVRQAISLEVAFSPEACRREAMRGMVLISLGDGAPRLALGSDAWRWSDLLLARGLRAPSQR
jgi:hypothetical protein